MKNGQGIVATMWWKRPRILCISVMNFVPTGKR